MMQQGKRLSTEIKQKVAKLIREEIEVEFIAERFGISDQAIRNVAKEIGLPMSGKHNRSYRVAGDLRSTRSS